MLGAVHGNVATTQILFILGLALIPAACASLTGALSGLAQNGGIALISVAPKFERINPVEGFKRTCSRETLGLSIRGGLGFACAALATAPAIIGCAGAVLRDSGITPLTAAVESAMQHVMFTAAAVGLVFAVVEYGAARGAWLRKLRMSFDERKREVKEEEGDATARGRRRAFHRALARSGLHRLRTATFVVSNPTHVAVALEYRPPEVSVPRVVVRAVDRVALRVRELAYVYRIPLVENVELARALYRDARPGEAIPQVHYLAVAEVVAALLRSCQITA
jgi:flagellar biosynthetic protein FlhB